jgi:pilus assembly protein Flp/PilA
MAARRVDRVGLFEVGGLILTNLREGICGRRWRLLGATSDLRGDNAFCHPDTQLSSPGADPQGNFVNSLKFRVSHSLPLRGRPVDNAGVEASEHSGGNVKRTVLNFLSDESGATAIEYGLIAAGISLAIIAIVNTLGGTLNTKFTDINTSLK